ncbi:MAG: hypothetical protein COS65_06280, partial [Armatimonadetes bacterium CG06_land_8_20_14_3_00_66_21]
IQEALDPRANLNGVNRGCLVNVTTKGGDNMARANITEATDVLDRMVAHWRERMGESFAVGDRKLADLAALRDQIAAAVQEYDTALEVANEKKAARDALLKQADAERANYRRQVAIAKGTRSSEYRTIPEPAKPKPRSKGSPPTA